MTIARLSVHAMFARHRLRPPELEPYGPGMRRLMVVSGTALALIAATGPTASGADATDPRPVTAVLESPALFDDDAGGNADGDDPAIWVNADQPARSLVIATVKDAGLRVYDLAGHERQAITPPPAPGPDDEAGRFNNVAILSDLKVAGQSVDVAVVTDRGHDHLRFYAIDAAAGLLVDITAPTVPFAFNTTQDEVNEQATAYGVAVFRGFDGKPYAAVTQRHRTTLGIFRILVDGQQVTYRRTDTQVFPQSFRLPSGETWSPCEEPGEDPQFEGLVVDPVTRVLYAAQEDVGFWRIHLVNGRFVGSGRIVERNKEFGVPATFDPETEECVFGPDPGFGGRIVSDVEGLTIYRTSLLGGVLLVSSQGDNTFYTYDRLTNRPLEHLAVVDGAATDGSQDCDGADVVRTPLPGFPNGLLVVHDGENTPDEIGADGEVRPNTNFKYLDAGVLLGG